MKTCPECGESLKNATRSLFTIRRKTLRCGNCGVVVKSEKPVP